MNRVIVTILNLDPGLCSAGIEEGHSGSRGGASRECCSKEGRRQLVIESSEWCWSVSWPSELVRIQTHFSNMYRSCFRAQQQIIEWITLYVCVAYWNDCTRTNMRCAWFWCEWRLASSCKSFADTVSQSKAKLGAFSMLKGVWPTFSGEILCCTPPDLLERLLFRQ